MVKKNSVSVIIPAYNEGQAIEMVLSELLAAIDSWNMDDIEVIVVNDGSSDNTAAVVSSFPQVRLINHRKNKGYGAAIKTGIRGAEGDIVIWYDADGQHRPEDLLKVILKMREEELEYCIGIRDSDSFEEKSRKFGKKVLKSILCFVTKEELRDFNSGMRGFRKDIITAYLSVLPDTFGASTVTTLLMLERDYKGGEVSITVRRRTGRSSVKQIRDGFRTIALIFQVIILFQPMRVFGKCGLVMCLVGFLYGVIRALQWSNGIPVLASILIIFGFQLICFGILSDQISKIRKQEYENHYISN